MWRATVKGLSAKKLRLALTVLAIVLGVGFMAGTYVLTDTINRSFDQLFTTATEHIDVIVQGTEAFANQRAAPGGGGATEERKFLPQHLRERIAQLSGVRVAEGYVQGAAALSDPDTHEPITASAGFAPTIGVSSEPRTTSLSLKKGHFARTSKQIAVDAATARKNHLHLGDRVHATFTDHQGTFKICGIVGFGDADNLAGATLAAFDLRTAQRLVLGNAHQLNSVLVQADDGVSATDLRARIAATLPKGYEAVTAADAAKQSADQVKSALSFLRTALLVFAFVALFVGAFIIFNTFSIIVAQRARELALLRVLGATSRQVLVSVLVEAILVGIVGSGLGVVAGIGIAIGLRGLLRAVGIDLPGTAIQLLPRTVLVSLVVGTLITLVAAVIPARRAARVAPIQALQESVAAAAPTRPWRNAVAGLVMLAAAGALLGSGLFGGGSNAGASVGAGAALAFLAVAVLLPVFARPLAGALGLPVAAFGVPGRLGRENSRRNPRRTASTAAALMVGLGLVSFVAVFASSLQASAAATLDQTLKADFILNTAQFDGFSTNVADRLREQETIGTVSAVKVGQFKHDGRIDQITAVDPATIGKVVSLGLTAGSVSGLEHRSTMLVDRQTASGNGWAVGERVRVVFGKTGKRKLTVAGIYTNSDVLGQYLISSRTYAKNFREGLDFIVLANAARGVPVKQARADIDKVLDHFSNVHASNQAQFKRQQQGLVNRLLNLVNALLVLAILIAFVGIVNTLGLSIYERIRELGLLRAVGMTRGGVRRMVLGESEIIALLGALLGIAIGVAFGWVMQRALAGQGIGVLSVPVPRLVAYAVVAGVLGLLAGVLPSIRASRVNILDAIAHE
jgi:putative ABC transport system permease protein